MAPDPYPLHDPDNRDQPPIFDPWDDLVSWDDVTPEARGRWWRLQAEVTALAYKSAAEAPE